MALCVCTLLLSIVGCPWMVSASESALRYRTAHCHRSHRLLQSLIVICAVAQPLPVSVLLGQRRQPEGRGGGAAEGVQDGGGLEEGEPLSMRLWTEFCTSKTLAVCARQGWMEVS
eukprot:1014188-Rhodomonas_salina.1